MNTAIDRILPADFRRFERNEVESSIPVRFAKVVAEHGSRVAVKHGAIELTYASLDHESNRIAQTLLRDRGPDPEPVALVYEQGTAFHIAQLGVLKSGKFFAAMDMDLRFEKQLQVLSALRPSVILCSAAMESWACKLSREIAGSIVINTESPQISHDAARPTVHAGPDSYACVVYTSGSTGPAIGVVMSHRSVLHFTMNQTNYMHLRKEDRASQLCPLSSGACVGETLPIFLNGAMLLPFRVKDRGIRNLARWLIDEKVTVYTSVPTLLRLLLGGAGAPDQFPDMRLVRISGDRILKNDFELFRGHFSDHCLLRVTLGAAEAGLYTQLYLHRSSSLARDVVPAGYALDDLQVSVVDENMQRVEPGEVGEIAVESRYLSVGYWNDDERTAERFLPSVDRPDARVYLTRDIGYLEEDGCLIHLGRKDARVKVYGKMVMLTDLEEKLLKLPGIENAVVVPVMSDRADTTLVAYYVARAHDAPPDDVIRRHLLTQFPLEVVPRKFVRLDELPLTDRNKIDRRRLMDWAQSPL